MSDEWDFYLEKSLKALEKPDLIRVSNALQVLSLTIESPYKLAISIMVQTDSNLESRPAAP